MGRSFPTSAITVMVAAGVVLTGCSSAAEEKGTDTASPVPVPGETRQAHRGASPPLPTVTPVGNLDELFEAVDKRLDCPGPDDGFSGEAHFFFAPGRSQLEGRQCGETIVMAWSKDESLIRSARELLRATGEPVPMVGTAEWFVADTTEAGEGGTGAPEHQARSKDLDRLAAELGATFTQR